MIASDANAGNHTAPQTPAGSPKHHRLPRLLFLIAICGLILLSTRALLDYGRLTAALWGRSFTERGMVGISGWHNFLNRSGSLDNQRIYRDARARGDSGQEVPALATAWAWAAQTGDQLPREARVYLNLPSSILYFYATTMWYPRKVDVGLSGALIKDDQTLQSASQSLEPGRFHELRTRGYSHVVTAQGDYIVIVDLRDGAGMPHP